MICDKCAESLFLSRKGDFNIQDESSKLDNGEAINISCDICNLESIALEDNTVYIKFTDTDRYVKLIDAYDSFSKRIK